jgi:hypothetical protein
MCDCPDGCVGSVLCGCEGKGKVRSLPSKTIDEGLEILMNKVQTLRQNFVAALGTKNGAAATEADLARIRAQIDSEQREIEKMLDLIKRQVGNTCIEMRVALGGTRNE